jgi:two-component system sensor histidine kinase KdpD
VRETGDRHLAIAAPPAGLLDRWRPGLAERLASELPDVHLHITAGQARPSGAARDAGDSPDRAPSVTGRQAHATVRVYLGYAPGCGITSAMLEEAGRRTSRGADVVVATVDCRGREGVSAALDSLEVIGDGTSLDTGAVLARHPEVVCIDDLSAADPSGESRFAAARQLADAGITVVATVHLGSLQDGDRAAGDTLDEAAVLALADEIELVDAPPSALAATVS